MADLFGLLTQSQPKIATGQALLLIDMQNDFIEPSGKLSIPGADKDFLGKIEDLVGSFRSRGDIIWVRSVFKAGRTVNDTSGRGDRVILEGLTDKNKKYGSKETRHRNDVRTSEASPPVSNIKSRMSQRSSSARVMSALQRVKVEEEGDDMDNAAEKESIKKAAILSQRDPELFLSESSAEQSKSADSNGSDFVSKIQDVIQPTKDVKIVKSHYSAFTETALLLILRAKFVTQLYLCGCFANISVYATALAAAQHGFDIKLVEDCLISRTESRHDEAMRQMVDLLGATRISSNFITNEPIEKLQSHANGSAYDEGGKSSGEGNNESTDTREIQELLQVVKLDDKCDVKAASGHREDENDHNTACSDEVDKEQIQKKITSDSGPSEAGHTVLDRTKNEINLKEPSVRTDEKQKHSSPSAQSPNMLTESPQKANMSDTEPRDLLDMDIGEGDSAILFDLIPSEYKDPTDSTKLLSDTIFTRLHQEVRWQKMYHVQGEVPRLVAVQGDIGEDGSMPVYRHPSDQSPPLLHFSPTVQLVRNLLQNKINQPVNHVLIQLYRSGSDYISEHSDKTLDIVRGSSILNVSFGAKRTMRLRTKKALKEKQAEEIASDRITQRVPMPHNSTFVLGEKTNMRWLHSITQDKRAPRDRSDAEKAYDGSRISLTFRHVGTYLDSDNKHIWGQGATSKSPDRRSPVVNGNKDLAQKMINAFGSENRSSLFNWDATYGIGFDVLHFYTDPPHLPLLFLSGNLLDDLTVLICLKELKLPFETIDAPILTKLSPVELCTENPKTEKEATQDLPASSNCRGVFYCDTDVYHTEVAGVKPILLYLDRYHHLGDATSESAGSVSTTSRSCTARAYSYLTGFNSSEGGITGNNTTLSLGPVNDSLNLSSFLQAWETELKDNRSFATGSCFTIADCLLWTQVHMIIRQEQAQEQDLEQHEEEKPTSQTCQENRADEKNSWSTKFPCLSAYHDRLALRPSIANILKEKELV